MSNDELSKLLREGLEMAERKMLEEKSRRNEKVVYSTMKCQMREISARYMLKVHFGR